MYLEAKECCDKNHHALAFPGGPVVPCHSGDMGSIPGQGTKIPHAAKQLSLHTAI